jgi:hypothetical protein
MSTAQLDRIVKGAPLPSSNPTSPPHQSPSIPPPAPTPPPPFASTDPIASLPSSPPQIYLNLLILEASLRLQYLTLRARRQQYTFFIFILALWIAYFTYALFLRPREDGRGVGGSVYWVVEITEKLALMGGVVTGVLVWGTGQWERGIRWPRRWIGVANRGLRSVNLKVVVIRGPWWREFLSSLSFLFPVSTFYTSVDSSYHYVDHSSTAPRKRHPGTGKHSHAHTQSHSGHFDDAPSSEEEDLAPGGDHIKILLLPKPFSPNFRENWESYRTEYWEKENERRANLRLKIRQHHREIARQEGGWFWWLKWRSWRRAHGMGGREGDLEKTHHRQLSEKDPGHLHASHSVVRSSSTSRSSSSRSSTPAITQIHDGGNKLAAERARRGSASAPTGERRKKPKAAGAGGSGKALSGSRSPTPTSDDGRSSDPSKPAGSGGNPRPTRPAAKRSGSSRNSLHVNKSPPGDGKT